LDLRRQVFVFEVGRKNKFDEGIAKKKAIVPIIEPEAHLIEVGWKVLRRAGG